MSATNRGTERDEQDFYPTPLAAFTPLLPYLAKVDTLEPACGDGRLVQAMRDVGIPAYGSDLFPQISDCQHVSHKPQDYLASTEHRACVLTNPPFSIAFEFCKHAVEHADEVYFLLRLNFLASDTRKEWLQAHEPAALFVLSKRPTFVQSISCKAKCGYKKLIPVGTPRPKACPMCGQKIRVTKSDSCEYAWFYWGNRHRGIIHL